MTAARAASTVIGAFSGIGLGIALADGRLAAIGIALVAAAGLTYVLRSIGHLNRPLGALVLGSFALHLAIAALLFAGALVLGRERDGFVVGDDAEYFYLSQAFASWVQGVELPPRVPPFWNGSAYLFGTFVYLQSALIYALGPDPLIIPFLNGAFYCLSAIVLFDLGRRLFDERSALMATGVFLFFPSTVLWSSLNLKDALALLILTTVLWELVRWRCHARWVFMAGAYLLLIPMQSLRPYLFLGLAGLIPIGAALASTISVRRRVLWTAATAAVSLLFILQEQTVPLGPGILETFQAAREGMAIQARTAYVIRPVYVTEGTTFIIPLPSRTPAAGQTPTPTPTPRPGGGVLAAAAAQGCTEPRFVHVPSHARIVIQDGSAATRGGFGDDIVIVRPCDIVIVGSTDVTPAPEARELPQDDVTLKESTSDERLLLVRTLAYLPTGMSYALFAPFPWALQRTVDMLTVPEMVVWYAAMALAAATLWRRRHDLLPLAVPALYAGGVTLLLSLVEGNVGTVYRHRGMLIPIVLLFAGPGMVVVGRWALAWARTRSARAAS